MEIKTAIIPSKQTYAKVDAKHELNLQAICVFAAIGFFLDKDTYWMDEEVLTPGGIHTLNSNNNIENSISWFEWYYSPRKISFNQALHEFSNLFETIIKEQTLNKKVILPLSGGIDSRTQAVALKAIGAEVFSYSYQFKGGYNETLIAKKIAETCNFEFKSYEIKSGYLWKSIDELFKLNKGYSDFTAPRQMGIFEEYSEMGDVFSLGHWGDVLFDSMNLPQLSKDEELDVIQKKLLKKGGLEFATDLWQAWKLPGTFESYFKDRVEVLLDRVKIDNTNAKLRAFKSRYWAPRWTSINLSVFEAVKPITLPYYDNRMCEFICTIPEEFLKDRKLQIAYIQSKSSELSKIEWQDQRPFNLTNYKYNKIPYNLPYKISNKLKRELKALSGKPYIQRNWELQFLGDENQLEMKKRLLESSLKNWIPKSLISKYYNHFYSQDSVQSAHAMNILLVLSKING